MTADWFTFDSGFLKTVSTRITNEVAGVSRVLYDSESLFFFPQSFVTSLSYSPPPKNPANFFTSSLQRKQSQANLPAPLKWNRNPISPHFCTNGHIGALSRRRESISDIIPFTFPFSFSPRSVVSRFIRFPNLKPEPLAPVSIFPTPCLITCS